MSLAYLEPSDIIEHDVNVNPSGQPGQQFDCICNVPRHVCLLLLAEILLCVYIKQVSSDQGQEPLLRIALTT